MPFGRSKEISKEWTVQESKNTTARIYYDEDLRSYIAVEDLYGIMVYGKTDKEALENIKKALKVRLEMEDTLITS
ncbi:MAG: hypothetical protein SFZ03_04290 [Candidatus Melainabacteria bacterium]|nr:hypothetical protein [Candidatus Melainabacteria bacterium]